MPTVDSLEAGSSHQMPQRTKPSPTLKRDFVWTFGGNAIYALCQWSILVLLAKLGTPELVGRYAFAVAVATPVITFANLSLRSVQVTDVKEEHTFSDYLGFRVWTLVAGLLLLTGTCAVMGYPADSTLLIALCAAALALEVLSDIYYGLMQIHFRMDNIAKSMILRGLLSISTFAAALWFTRSLTGSLWALLASRMLILLVYDMGVGIRSFRSVGSSKVIYFVPRFSLTDQKRILRVALPVGLIAVLVAFNASIPRYFIQWSVGAKGLGIFSALCFFQSSGNMLSNALGQAAFVRLARAYAKEDVRDFVRLLGKLLLIGLALGIAGFLISIVAGRPILRILYRPEYAERADLLQILMIATGVSYLSQFIGYAVTAARIFNPQIPLFVVVLATLTASCYLLVPSRGLTGAIWAILISSSVQCIGSMLLLAAAFRRRARVPVVMAEAVGIS